MNNHTIRNCLFFFYLCSLFYSNFLHLVQVLAKSPPYQIYVANGLPRKSGKLRVHCASKDQEVGYFVIPVKENIHWSFDINFIGSTMYFCHFWLGTQDRAFEVFNMDVANNCYFYQDRFHCYWLVKKDGFYYTGHVHPNPDPHRFVKKYNWTE